MSLNFVAQTTIPEVSFVSVIRSWSLSWCSDYFILLDFFKIDRAMPFAAAKELDSYPLLSKYIESINCVLIDRKSDDLQVMREQSGKINKAIINTGLVLFPEGECSYLDDDIKDFKKGGFVGTINKCVMVVPTYISSPNMDKVFKWYVPTGEVSVTFGKAFIPERELGPKVKAKQVSEYTKKKVLELKNNR